MKWKEDIPYQKSILGKRPAVFLDRDGVLTREKSYVRSIEELEIFPYAEECIRRIRNKGYYAIVVTNQSGVARGYFTEETLLSMNRYLKEKTGVDAVYYCPHCQQGMMPKYAVYCNCRKPGTGMIERACDEFEIDMEHSYLAGDRACDIRMGEQAGLRTILLESGYGSERLEEKVTPDYIMKDLREFVEFLSEKNSYGHEREETVLK